MKVSPKLRLISIIVLLIVGSGFIVFAVFFNRGTLEVIADLPYNVNIIGLKSQSCTVNPCAITLAPGDYSVQISKTEYQTISDQVQLSIGQTITKSYQLQPVPRFQPLGPWNPDRLFSNQETILAKLSNLDLFIPSSHWSIISNQLGKLSNFTYLEVNSAGTWIVAETAEQALAIPLSDQQSKPINLPLSLNYYFAPHSSVIYFIADNPDNSLPALFRKDLSVDQPPELLINFIRTIANPRLIINQEQTKVALLEQSNNQQANLYLIDLQAKTRQLVNQEELISNFLWLPTQQASANVGTNSTSPSQKFILEKINSSTLRPNLYLADSATPEDQALLPLDNDLTDLFPIDSNHLLIAQAFPNALAPSAPGFSIENFDLSTQKLQPIYSVSDLALPQKLQYESANQTLYLLIAGTVYSLSPIL